MDSVDVMKYRFSAQASRILTTLMMKRVCVYKGLGALDEYSALLLRSLTNCLEPSCYTLQYISPELIVQGELSKSVRLLAIGAGYDLGLIKALGTKGMANIREFVYSGGAYLGICSGAYFACDRIEFDKNGPLEVVGDRQLKFFPGVCIGPLYKPYDYKSRSGAVAAHIGFQHPMYGQFSKLADLSTPATKEASQQNCNSNRHEACYDVESRSYFSGGGNFVLDKSELNGQIKVLVRYLDVAGTPVAMVSCNVGQGRAILSGVHIEVTGEDIDDGDKLVEHMVPVLNKCTQENILIFKCLLQELNLQAKL